MNALGFLYNTIPGRILLRPLISRPVSELSGKLLDSSISKVLISPFAKKNSIVMEDYRLDDVRCFNDFFCRRIRPELRPVDQNRDDLIAPCDGLLSVYKIDAGTILDVKQSHLSVRRLLHDRRLAESFEDGYALVFRLCVNHYHRYIYFDSGRKYKNRRIKGVYHTVRPIALERYPVFTENIREYTIIDTENFGRCVQMEVGAMLVGRIVNDKHFPCEVKRGDEKGHFEYGGSTIIVLVPKDQVQFRNDIIATVGSGREIPVIMGECVGCK